MDSFSDAKGLGKMGWLLKICGQTNSWTVNSQTHYRPVIKDSFPHMAKKYCTISTIYQC